MKYDTYSRTVIVHLDTLAQVFLLGFFAQLLLKVLKVGDRLVGLLQLSRQLFISFPKILPFYLQMENTRENVIKGGYSIYAVLVAAVHTRALLIMSMNHAFFSDCSLVSFPSSSLAEIVSSATYSTAYR